MKSNMLCEPEALKREISCRNEIHAYIHIVIHYSYLLVKSLLLMIKIIKSLLLFVELQ